MSAQAEEVLTRSDADAARLSLALRRVSRWLRRQANSPIGHGALSALATIAAEGPLRLGDLAGREGLSPASLSRIVAVLVTDGYVGRLPDPDDGRSWQVTITPEGERLLTKLRAGTAQVILERLARLSPSDRAAIVAALPALEAMASDGSESGDEMLS